MATSNKDYLIQSLLSNYISKIPPNSQCNISKMDLIKLHEYLKDLQTRISTIEATLIRNNIT